MKNYVPLEWDSNFFGFKVARISNRNLNTIETAEILEELKAQNTRLVYWPKSLENEISAEIAAKYNGMLVDEKLTFFKSLNAEVVGKLPNYEGIAEYPAQEPDSRLLDLAVSSGKYSRFKKDPRIPEEKFTELYHLWMRNSTLRTFAKTVLVLKENNEIMGMVTLNGRGKRGIIGIIAVDAGMRGKGIGMHLLQAADKWFWNAGYKEVEVMAQQANAARIFYLKSGFEQVEKSLFYHFWL